MHHLSHGIQSQPLKLSVKEHQVCSQARCYNQVWLLIYRGEKVVHQLLQNEVKITEQNLKIRQRISEHVRLQSH